MSWLQRWNFIERARLEREIWDAFERGADLDALVAGCEPGFRRDVWQTTLERIRRIEATMAGRRPPGPPGPTGGTGRS